MSEIVLEQVTKRYGRVTAVEGVSFRAERGSFVVLLGPSGCGKSTLLRLIAGLEEVSAGKIHIEGREVTALDPTERRLSMVFQSYALFPHLSVAENIVFGLKVRGLPAAERRERLAPSSSDSRSASSTSRSSSRADSASGSRSRGRSSPRIRSA